MHTVAPYIAETAVEALDLNVSQDVVSDIMSMCNNATEERTAQADRLRQLIVLLVAPPKPFVNLAVDAVEYASSVLLAPGDESRTAETT